MGNLAEAKGRKRPVLSAANQREAGLASAPFLFPTCLYPLLPFFWARLPVPGRQSLGHLRGGAWLYPRVVELNTPSPHPLGQRSKKRHHGWQESLHCRLRQLVSGFCEGHGGGAGSSEGRGAPQTEAGWARRRQKMPQAPAGLLRLAVHRTDCAQLSVLCLPGQLHLFTMGR